MRLLGIGKRFRLIWLVVLVSFLIALSSCGNGVSQDEFDAEQARAQALQQRLDRAAAITEVLDTLTNSFEEGPSGQAILQISALIQASGDTQLQAKWEEIGESVGAEPPSEEALNAIGAAVQASGSQQLTEKWQEVVAALERDEGAAEILEFAELVTASGDTALQTALVESFEAGRGRGNPPWQLFREFQALVETSGDAQIEEAVNRLGEPSPEVIEDVRVKLKTIGDPSLEALFEASYESLGEEFGAFLQAMSAALSETLQ